MKMVNNGQLKAAMSNVKQVKDRMREFKKKSTKQIAKMKFRLGKIKSVPEKRFLRIDIASAKRLMRANMKEMMRMLRKATQELKIVKDQMKLEMRIRARGKKLQRTLS